MAKVVTILNVSGLKVEFAIGVMAMRPQGHFRADPAEVNAFLTALNEPDEIEIRLRQHDLTKPARFVRFHKISIERAPEVPGKTDRFKFKKFFFVADQLTGLSLPVPMELPARGF